MLESQLSLHYCSVSLSICSKTPDLDSLRAHGKFELQHYKYLIALKFKFTIFTQARSGWFLKKWLDLKIELRNTPSSVINRIIDRKEMFS